MRGITLAILALALVRYSCSAGSHKASLMALGIAAILAVAALACAAIGI